MSDMVLHTMPSGVVVAFDGGTPEEERHDYYLVHDDDVVSLEGVTTALGVCPKPGLPWWGMEVGVAGTLQLLKEGEIELGVDDGGTIEPDDVVDLLKLHKLTVNHVRDKAGLRGDEAHAIGEALAAGEVPDLSKVEHPGYAEGLMNVWLDLAPQPIATEQVVCSPSLLLAGTLDLRCLIPEGRTAVVDAETGWREPIPAGEWIIDYKTPKAVYESHLLQVRGYDDLSVESGYGAADHCGVLRLTPDGGYELVESWATSTAFESAYRFHRSLIDLKAGAPKRPRKCSRGEKAGDPHHFIPEGRERICEVCR